MEKIQIVIDTNVFLSALRSRRGASFKLLSLIGSNHFEINLSVPLILEYEEVAKRYLNEILLSLQDIEDILDFLCDMAHQHEIYYLWRPDLKDPKDDLVLELAVKSGSQYIITFNQRDFRGSERFDVQTLTPGEFLKRLEQENGNN